MGMRVMEEDGRMGRDGMMEGMEEWEKWEDSMGAMGEKGGWEDRWMGGDRTMGGMGGQDGNISDGRKGWE